jgi:hypothetical protein
MPTRPDHAELRPFRVAVMASAWVAVHTGTHAFWFRCCARISDLPGRPAAVAGGVVSATACAPLEK